MVVSRPKPLTLTTEPTPGSASSACSCDADLMNESVNMAPIEGFSDTSIALVAGASRGLGFLIAGELARRGYHVAICSRDQEALDGAAHQLREQGAVVTARECDISDAVAVEQLIDDIESTIGPIQVAVCVAGIIEVGPFDSLTREHFEQAIGTMLWGPINVALPLAKRMKLRHHGRIGIVSSIGGMVGVPHLLPYSTAKFGAFGFSQGLRSELSGSGVSVTSVVPGLMRVGSHLRAQFSGNQPKEYTWFAIGASTPGLSINADRAAARITDGVLRGRGMVLLTPLAKIGVRVHGIAPSLTAAAIGRVGRLLPGPAQTATATIDGQDAESRIAPRARRILRTVTILGERAAQRNRERPKS